MAGGHQGKCVKVACNMAGTCGVQDGDPVLHVLRLAAAECELDADGPLVRIMAGRLEQAFYNTAADLRSLDSSGWAQFALPPPLEVASRRILEIGGWRRLGQDSQSQDGRQQLTASRENAPRNESLAHAGNIWSALIQRDSAAASTSNASKVKRRLKVAPDSHSHGSTTTAQIAAGMPTEVLPCRYRAVPPPETPV